MPVDYLTISMLYFLFLSLFYSLGSPTSCRRHYRRCHHPLSPDVVFSRLPGSGYEVSGGDREEIECCIKCHLVLCCTLFLCVVSYIMSLGSIKVLLYLQLCVILFLWLCCFFVVYRNLVNTNSAAKDAIDVLTSKPPIPTAAAVAKCRKMWYACNDAMVGAGAMRKLLR
jgi:hypothetical protein